MDSIYILFLVSDDDLDDAIMTSIVFKFTQIATNILKLMDTISFFFQNLLGKKLDLNRASSLCGGINSQMFYKKKSTFCIFYFEKYGLLLLVSEIK